LLLLQSNLQHGRGVYTWAKGDVYDGSWCLEYGTMIRTYDPSRPTVLVEDLLASDVQRVSLVGQDDAKVSLLALDKKITSHAKFVIEDVDHRSHAVTRNHRVPLVWGANPTYSHRESLLSGSLSPAWTVTVYVKSPTPQHPHIGRAVTIQQRYWPNESAIPEPDLRVEQDAAKCDFLTAPRPVFRGSKAEARDHLAAFVREVSLLQGDVVELEAEELWARMESEFRNQEVGQPDRVNLAIATSLNPGQSIPASEPHARRVWFDASHQANFDAVYAQMEIDRAPYFVVASVASGGYQSQDISAHQSASRRQVDIVYMVSTFGRMDTDDDGNRCETARCLQEMWQALGIDLSAIRVMFTELNPVGQMGMNKSPTACAAMMRCALELGTASIAAFGVANEARWRDVANLLPQVSQVEQLEHGVSLQYRGQTVRVFLGDHPSVFSPSSRKSCVRALASAHSWCDGKVYQTHRLYESDEPGIRSVPIKEVVKHVMGDYADEEASNEWSKLAKTAGKVVAVQGDFMFQFVNIAVDGNHRFQLANGILTRNSDVRMHGIGKYSWPDGIVYLGEWVLGLQTGLGFKWSGLGTRPQFGRWLDNKLVQSLYVSPAVLAKMPGWTVEEFKAELEGKWAEMARTSAMQTSKVTRATPPKTKPATACTCTCKAKVCTCGCPCEKCVGSRSRVSSACCSTHPTSATSTPSDEWNSEVQDLIVKMRTSMEPHHFYQKNTHATNATSAR
jgi:hypothetical protein